MSTNETGYTKAKIFNVALSLLLLQRQLVNPISENSNEAKVLNLQWDIALSSALADMNLNSTSIRMKATLVARLFGPGADFGEAHHHWKFAYQYPSDCGFFRRIISRMEIDDKSSHIPKIVSLYKASNGNIQKVIFTNHHQHREDGSDGIWIEYIPKEFPIPQLSPSAAMAIGARLAGLGAPLIVGKGARTLIDSIDKKYVMWKAEAQQQDANESFFFETEATMSEFVRSRLSGYGEGDVDI